MIGRTLTQASCKQQKLILRPLPVCHSLVHTRILTPEVHFSNVVFEFP